MSRGGSDLKAEDGAARDPECSGPSQPEGEFEVIALEEATAEQLEALEEGRASRLEVARAGTGLVRVTPRDGESLGDACRRLLEECATEGRPYVVVLSVLLLAVGLSG